MISELFSVGPFSVSPFGVLLVAALFGAFLQMRWGMKRLKIGGEDDANTLLLAAAIGGIVGGKIYYAALYGDWGLLLNRAGIVYYGSLIGGTLAVSLMIRLRGLPFARTADTVAPGVAVGYAIGRVGCLLVGDDYGIPTTLPWGMTFPEGPIPTTAAALERNFDVEIPAGVEANALIPVHPTQVYETLIAGAIWLWARRRTGKTAWDGLLALSVFALLSVERFFVEFLRAKDDRLLGPLTLAQGISIAIVVLVLALWLRGRSRHAAESV